MQNNNLQNSLKNWRSMVKQYQQPNTKKAIGQLLNSFLPFIGLWVLMYFSLNWSYWITIALAIVTAFFLVRIFVIQHDCGHQSFLKSRKWNNAIGYVTSFFTSIPYTYWSRMHDLHHAHNAQIEYRGLGDINYLTTEEYSNRSPFKRFNYRIRRSPVMQFLIIPIIYLSIVIRYPYPHAPLKRWKKIRWPHVLNNVLMVLIFSALAFTLGWQKFLLIQIPVLSFFIITSFWLFYIQHQHEENYKEWRDTWDHLMASVRGSTYYKLPRMFQWLSGNIGFHHIHHLSSRIPNYNLEACAIANPELGEFVNVITFRESLKCIHYKLWDEEQRRMITFKEFNTKAQQY